MINNDSTIVLFLDLVGFKKDFLQGNFYKLCIIGIFELHSVEFTWLSWLIQKYHKDDKAGWLMGIPYLFKCIRFISKNI